MKGRRIPSTWQQVNWLLTHAQSEALSIVVGTMSRIQQGSKFIEFQ